MKMFVVLALAAVACAEPEADPQLSLYTAGYPINTYSAINQVPSYQQAVPVNTYSAYQQVAPASTYATLKQVVPASAYSTLKQVVPASTYSTLKQVVPASTYSTLKQVAPASTYSTLKQVVPASTYSTLKQGVPASTYSTLKQVVPASTYSTLKQVPVATYANVAAPIMAYSGMDTTLTGYNNPNHYTAVSSGVYGPKYIAKNYGVEHIVKREAEAEPQVYSYPTMAYTALNSVLPAVSYSNINTAAPAVPYYNSAIPATYSSIPVTYSGVPATYSGVATTYTSYAANPIMKSMYAPHAVVATPFGYTHSSNVGICTNNKGAQVAC